jgi:hypothetical protein
MARQMLQDAGPVEPAIADPLAANAATTAVGMWNSQQYTPIFAYDAKPTKMYIVEAGGLITTAATGALTISPSISTTNAAGTTLGASIAQTVPASSLSGPWYLRMVLIVRTTGAPGGERHYPGHRVLSVRWRRCYGQLRVLDLTFGGTAAAFDHSVNQTIWISKTLSVAGSFTTQWAAISSRN